MLLHLGVMMEMKYPIGCVWCFPNAVYLNLKEHIIFRTSNSLASLNSMRQLELKPAATVRTFNNVSEIRSKPRLLKMQATEKDTAEADREVREEERRRKIGLANKGKVPWNKGIKHTQDTRRRIKQRTIEALRNPKVRDKMSEHQQPHSDETKEKIRASMKQIWAERSRSKRLKEKFTSLWSESIAEAARRGGSGEVELDWDSYDKAKQEISSEEKARTKKQNKMRAEEAKTEKKMRRVVERKKEGKERDQRGGKTRKPQQNKESATTASRSKLKKRLTKIHKKKTSLGKIAVGKDRVVSVAAKLEKLDLELIIKERTRGDISLADQIQAAKNQRGNDFSSRFGLFAMKSMDFD
ncbi:PREDICTED: translation initiation factor IF-2-like [Brassica oleracea var. oleracea]|uniref:translation initiation factor IF-2-like n=1 Tax=Brassica oleracea var. oleracea TaxID=109376 RepID=UPI0006A6FA85|nr:PREDICTED: translation initiation factor IF-2-like [Brassica oleracea var. oleracea]